MKPEIEIIPKNHTEHVQVETAFHYWSGPAHNYMEWRLKQHKRI